MSAEKCPVCGEENAEYITAEIESAAGQPALMLSAYDMPVHWRPGDVVRITLERQVYITGINSV